MRVFTLHTDAFTPPPSSDVLERLFRSEWDIACVQELPSPVMGEVCVRLAQSDDVDYAWQFFPYGPQGGRYAGLLMIWRRDVLSLQAMRLIQPSQDIHPPPANLLVPAMFERVDIRAMREAASKCNVLQHAEFRVKDTGDEISVFNYRAPTGTAEMATCHQDSAFAHVLQRARPATIVCVSNLHGPSLLSDASNYAAAGQYARSTDTVLFDGGLYCTSWADGTATLSWENPLAGPGCSTADCVADCVAENHFAEAEDAT